MLLSELTLVIEKIRTGNTIFICEVIQIPMIMRTAKQILFEKIQTSIKKTIESTLIKIVVNNKILKCSRSRILEELEPVATHGNSRNLCWLHRSI